MKVLMHILAFFILANPLFPVVEYLVHKDYIAKELCVNRARPELLCNGKCYLKKELVKKIASETDSSSKKNDIRKVAVPVLFVVENTNVNLLVPITAYTTTPLITTTNNSYNYLYARGDLRPPIFS